MLRLYLLQSGVNGFFLFSAKSRKGKAKFLEILLVPDERGGGGLIGELLEICGQLISQFLTKILERLFRVTPHFAFDLTFNGFLQRFGQFGLERFCIYFSGTEAAGGI